MRSPGALGGLATQALISAEIHAVVSDRFRDHLEGRVIVLASCGRICGYTYTVDEQYTRLGWLLG